ncbi:precorrin-2 C(20)-methyltransferase [Vibrio intestinalis]|uniref:precorrin-2 C(20)-methyltransferase n=1 Tax=Vibrio intestinalis TaxID=2933291 RepID=UPI0021A81260|nr:precorrin-2 C(20)-methyltransferase [Vibrio intestinalis]
MALNKAKLYAIGLGPGDGELLTLKGMRLVQECDVLAIPERNKGAQDSFAWEILQDAFSSVGVCEQQIGTKRCFLHFPMTRDCSVTVPAWQDAARQIYQFLQQGLSVAFVTEGDPSVYSTWSYIQEELLEMDSSVKSCIEVVPGVSSITAVPSVTQQPLADGKERFCVVPATYGLEHIEELSTQFDTIIFIKVGRVVQKLTERLKALNLVQYAQYVSHATTDKQAVYSSLEQVPKEHRYFSMVQLSIRQSRGALRGMQPIDQQVETVLE